MATEEVPQTLPLPLLTSRGGTWVRLRCRPSFKDFCPLHPVGGGGGFDSNTVFSLPKWHWHLTTTSSEGVKRGTQANDQKMIVQAYKLLLCLPNFPESSEMKGVVGL